MKILDEDLKLCKSKTDDGEQLVWLPLEEIALQEIKPTFPEWGRKAPPHIINKGFKGKIPC